MGTLGLTQFSELPSAVPLYVPEFYRWSEISSFSKVILVLGKPEVWECQIWTVGGLSHLGDLMFHQKTARRSDTWAGTLSWWSCQSPVAHSCGLLNHWNSFHRGMFKLNAQFDADSLLFLLSHFECDDHTVHMLTQQHLSPPLTSTVMSSLFTHVHSSPLSLAARLHQCHTNCSCDINSGWTFSGQTCVCVWVCVCVLEIGH